MTKRQSRAMHFIDFLLHLICFICWTLKTAYIFSIDYLIPIVGHILPVVIKYLSQLFSLLLRIFFTYVSPCIIQLLSATTYICTRLLNGISVASMTIIESDVNLEYAHAILMVSIVVVVMYFHITEKILRFFYGWYQMIAMYLRFFLNILKFVRFCYRKVFGILLNRQQHPDNTKAILNMSKQRHTIAANGVNGSAHRIKGEKSE